jgi:hypothetical protein
MERRFIKTKYGNSTCLGIEARCPAMERCENLDVSGMLMEELIHNWDHWSAEAAQHLSDTCRPCWSASTSTICHNNRNNQSKSKTSELAETLAYRFAIERQFWHDVFPSLLIDWKEFFAVERPRSMKFLEAMVRDFVNDAVPILRTRSF